jgi:3-hydroxyisobutyrate dehydrogenase-like beta-hydroxyacid dehydrogenase
MRVGVVGLGSMGAAMATRLAAGSGVTVTGFDLDPAKGGVASLSEVAASLVILSLPDERAVGAVLQPLLTALPQDAVI